MRWRTPLRPDVLMYWCFDDSTIWTKLTGWICTCILYKADDYPIVQCCHLLNNDFLHQSVLDSSAVLIVVVLSFPQIVQFDRIEEWFNSYAWVKYHDCRTVITQHAKIAAIIQCNILVGRLKGITSLFLAQIWRALHEINSTGDTAREGRGSSSIGGPS